MAAEPAFMSNVGGAVQHAADLNAAIGSGFSLDYEGAQQLLTFVTSMETAVAKVLRRADVLSQEPQLGSTPAANVYKPYLPSIATDPGQGFLPVMAKLQQQLNQAATNIQGSLTEYEQNEQNVTGSMVNIHPV
jgi:hypothetical protein